jgi:hypothetical protein
MLVAIALAMTAWSGCSDRKSRQEEPDDRENTQLRSGAGSGTSTGHGGPACIAALSL